MTSPKTKAEWITQYSSSHQNTVNRFLHTFGIPIIVISVLLFIGSIFMHSLLNYAVWLFVFGWILQFVGHAFERKMPEFFHDWRFLFVGVGWWWAKIQKKA